MKKKKKTKLPPEQEPLRNGEAFPAEDGAEEAADSEGFGSFDEPPTPEDSEGFFAFDEPAAEQSGEAKTPPQASLSPEELAMLRATLKQSNENREEPEPYDQSDRAHMVRFAKKNKLISVAVLIILLGLIGGMIAGGFMIYSWLDSRPNGADFTIVLGDEEPYTVPYDHFVRDGVFYIDMIRIAKFGKITYSGSERQMQFTAAGNCYLRFVNGSEYATVNGDRIAMQVESLDEERTVTAKAIISETECLIPYEILTRALSGGLLCRLDRETNTLTVKRVYYNEEDPEEMEAADILFRSDAFTVIPPETEAPKYEYFYTIDITPYLGYITSEDLLLANKITPLGGDYIPGDLTQITGETANNRQLYLRQTAQMALEAMMLEMTAEGVEDVYVTSAYRSYERQKTLYYTTYYNQEKAKHPDWTDEQIYAEISTYSAKPGESEHQTGLCLDFMTSTMRELDNSFETTAAFAWLSENAYKFGFILRYDEDKVDITGYSYESWHYRFVGREAATEMHFSGLCLEEYLAGSEEETR